MKGYVVGAIMIAGLVTLAQLCPCCQTSKANDPPEDSVPSTLLGTTLRIYLPREVTIQACPEPSRRDDYLRLGQVTVIRGDESLVAKASDILLGQISVPGQKLVIERPTILSRLACNGIPAYKVTLTGAKEIEVKQQQQIIKGEKFVELAKSFMAELASQQRQNNPHTGSVCQWEPIRTPADLILAGASKDVKFSPQLIETGQASQTKVRITVLVPDSVGDGKELATREVTLRAKYKCRRAVTVTQIAAGAVISPENVKIEEDICDHPEPANWRPPYGLVARRRLPANTVISPEMLDAAKNTARIKRNQTVVIIVQMPGLVVTAMGKTLQDGHVGEHIKVRNLDSQRIILCRVNEDGTVGPIF